MAYYRATSGNRSCTGARLVSSRRKKRPRRGAADAGDHRVALYGYGQNPNYLSAFNLANILALATALGFIALGQTIPLLLAEGHGRAVAFALAPGQAHDLPMAPGLLGCLPEMSQAGSWATAGSLLMPSARLIWASGRVIYVLYT